MAEDDVVEKYPSLPPNYVSLAQLRQRWLQQKQQQQEEEQKQKQIEKEAEEKRLQQQQEKENLIEFGKGQNIDRFGYFGKRSIEKKKGYNKEKGKARVVKDVEKGVNSSGGLNGKSGESERYNEKFKAKGGFGGQEGSKGGFKKNGGDHRLKFGVSENVVEGEVESGGEDLQVEKGMDSSGCLNRKSGENERYAGKFKIKGSVGGIEGSKGGLKKNGDDHRLKFGVCGNVGEGEVESMREDFGGEKKATDTGIVWDEDKSANGARSKQRYKKSWNKKGTLMEKVSSDFEKLTLEEGRKKNGKVMWVSVAKERISVVGGDLNDRKDKCTCQLRRNGNDGGEKGEILETAGEGKVADNKGVRLEGEKEDVGVVLVNEDKDMKEINRGRHRGNRHEKGMARGKIRWDFEREIAREIEAPGKTVEVFSLSTAVKDRCESGMQRNGDDQMVNGGESLKNVTKGKGLVESAEKLGGEIESVDEGLAIPSQGNGERVRFKGGYQQNWSKKEVSRAKIGRAFEGLQSNDERNGKGRGRDMMNVEYRKYQRKQKSATSRTGKGSDNGLMWVKKGVISDANGAGLRPSDLLMKATSDDLTDWSKTKVVGEHSRGGCN